MATIKTMVKTKSKPILPGNSHVNKLEYTSNRSKKNIADSAHNGNIQRTLVDKRKQFHHAMVIQPTLTASANA